MSSSSPKRGGLPNRRQMRHDAHYVDVLANRFEEPVGKSIPIGATEPNPLQPRAHVGELKDLIASVKERGVLEPLIVRAAVGGRYQLVSGERRLRAAQAAGLNNVPCVEIDVDDGEALEVALVENLLRRDLNLFEEADGLAALKERFEYTHQDLSRKLGRSRSSITETLSIASIPEPVREICAKHGLASASTLLQVARAGDRQKMEATALRIAAGDAQRDDLVAERKKEKGGKAQAGRPKPYAYRWQPEEKSFAVQIKFRKSRVSRREVLEAVRQLLADLEDEA